MRHGVRALLAAAAMAVAPLLPAQTLPEPTGPGELVLPPIVLEVAGLAEVKVEARLPAEDELLPPERRFPLPEPGALVIVEPELPAATGGGGAEGGAGAGTPVKVRAELGVGIFRDLAASVDLSAGEEPVLDVSFDHDSRDGFGTHPPGSGFDERRDDLAVSLSLAPWGTDLAIDATWNEEARGLQGLAASYTGEVARSLGVTAAIGGRPLPWLALAGGLEVANDELVLGGTVPARFAETGVSPSASATATRGAWTLGLAARYAFHAGTLIADPFADGHRFRADLSAGVELAPGWRLDGAVGWHWSGETGSAFPFHLGFSGAPLPFLAFALRGGLRAVGVDLGDVLAAHPLLLPVATVDSSGWFGALDLTLGTGGAISATAGLQYAAASAMLDASATPDAATGLHPVLQRATDGLALTAGLRWSIAAWLTLSASAVVNLPDRPWYAPAGTLNVEVAALEASGRAGATLSLAGEAGSGGVPLPRLDLGGFLRVSPAVRLRLDADDLLAPLTAPRVELGAFERPGLRVVGSVHLEL